MRCETNDLAITTRPLMATDAHGAKVCALPAGHIVRLGRLVGLSPPMWELRVPVRAFTPLPGASHVMAVADAAVYPLRMSRLADETLAWKPVP